MSNGKDIRVRIAPSPTGNLHIGTARASLFNFLYARKMGGVFIVRIEDTDKARSKKEYEDNIKDGLAWLGLEYDEYHRQSDREEIYKRYLAGMIENGHAYVSKEEPKEEGQRDEVIRFKNPNKQITFTDIIRGEVSFDTSDLGDFVIARSMEEPLYHLAVVVDDHEMGISHVIRGEDHISNTPRQILIGEAIGAQRPVYAHLPLILGKDRSKLSKRHGATSLTEYRERGYLPSAMVNYLALLGWNPGTDQEIMSLNEITEQFSLEKIQKGGAIFDEEKLKWINKEHIKRLSPEERVTEIKKRLPGKQIDDEMLEKIEPIITERISVWNDVLTLAEGGELDYFFADPMYDTETLFWKGEKDPEKTLRLLESAAQMLDKLSSDDFTSDKIKETIWPLAEKEGKGDVLWPLRVSLSGLPKSPDPFTIAEIIGKEKTLLRIAKAREKLAEIR